MAKRKIELEILPETFDALGRIAASMGLHDHREAAEIALLDWIAHKQAELDNRDPAQRYFINEALDELLEKKR